MVDRSTSTSPASEQPATEESGDAAVLQKVAAVISSLGVESRAEHRVKTIAPWVISVAIHTGVIVLAVFITWTVTHLPQEKDESVLIVADFNALNYVPVAGIDATTGEQGSPAPLVQDVLQPLPQEKSIADQLNESSDDPMRAIANLGNVTDRMNSGASALSSFAPQGGPNTATFGGLTGSNARKIVYVIDASGSMAPYLWTVLDELARSLSNLSARQSFTVVFFKGLEAIEVPPAGKLINATEEEQARVIAWIKENVGTGSVTNPIVGIQKALALKPDVIFLLSQNITGYGQFEVDQKDLLDMLDGLNPINPQSGRRTTQINCIQFIDEDPLGTMPLIAQQHGGPKGYRFMSRAELGLGPK